MNARLITRNLLLAAVTTPACVTSTSEVVQTLPMSTATMEACGYIAPLTRPCVSWLVVAQACPLLANAVIIAAVFALLLIARITTPVKRAETLAIDTTPLTPC